ncbi:putative galactolipase [Helianthus debilis subsp. tardiflorus]
MFSYSKSSLFPTLTNFFMIHILQNNIYIIFYFLNNSYAFYRRLKSIFRGPLYDGKYLHDSIRKICRRTKLGDASTNLVIPTFDIKRLKPTIFSSIELKEKPYMNAYLSDICIATSAAPTYLPPHIFETSHDGKEHTFDLIDGGVALNNPVMLL